MSNSRDRIPEGQRNYPKRILGLENIDYTKGFFTTKDTLCLLLRTENS